MRRFTEPERERKGRSGREGTDSRGRVVRLLTYLLIRRSEVPISRAKYTDLLSYLGREGGMMSPRPLARFYPEIMHRPKEVHCLKVR